MITADQLLAHVVGDYLLQSDWMAKEKVRRSLAAALHAVVYTMSFILLTTSLKALLFVAGTHFVIDRWRLARYICWVKNWIAIPDWSEFDYDGYHPSWVKINKPWDDCKANGYDPDRPVWLTTWLLIITDNAMHVILNGFAIRWLS